MSNGDISWGTVALTALATLGAIGVISAAHTAGVGTSGAEQDIAKNAVNAANSTIGDALERIGESANAYEYVPLGPTNLDYGNTRDFLLEITETEGSSPALTALKQDAEMLKLTLEGDFSEYDEASMGKRDEYRPQIDEIVKRAEGLAKNHEGLESILNSSVFSDSRNIATGTAAEAITTPLADTGESLSTEQYTRLQNLSLMEHGDSAAKNSLIEEAKGLLNDGDIKPKEHSQALEILNKTKDMNLSQVTPSPAINTDGADHTPVTHYGPHHNLA